MNENEVEGIAIANLIAADEETIVGWVYRWNTGALAIRWDTMARSASQSFARISAMPIKLKLTSRLSRSCPVATTDMVEYGLYGPRLCECACVAGLFSYRLCATSLRLNSQ